MHRRAGEIIADSLQCFSTEIVYHGVHVVFSLDVVSVVCGYLRYAKIVQPRVTVCFVYVHSVVFVFAFVVCMHVLCAGSASVHIQHGDQREHSTVVF